MGIAAFKVFMVVDTGRDYPHMPGIGVHDHGKLLEIFETVAPTGVAADGPSPRPGADGPHRARVLGARRARLPGLRQGLRRVRRHHLGHRRGAAAAAPAGHRHAAPPAAHPDHGRRRAAPARPRRAARTSPPSSTRGPSSWATTGRTSSGSARTRSRTGCPEKNTEPLWAALARRHHRPDLDRPRAAHRARRRSPAGPTAGRPTRARRRRSSTCRCSSTRRAAGRISLERVVSATATAPARIFGLADQGSPRGGPRRRHRDRRPRRGTGDHATRSCSARSARRPTPARASGASSTRTLVRGAVVYEDGRVIGAAGLGPPGPAQPLTHAPQREGASPDGHAFRSAAAALRRGGRPGPADRGCPPRGSTRASTPSGCGTTSSSIPTAWKARTGRSSSRS